MHSWQSASAKKVAIMPVFQTRERIATPVCGLVRNDVVVTMVQTELFDKAFPRGEGGKNL